MKIVISACAVFFSLALSGCGEPDIFYIEPQYATIKAVDKIPSKKITIDENGLASAEDIKTMISIIRAHSIKEKYYDDTIFKWNTFANEQNAEAIKHNAEVQKQVEGGFFDFFK